MRACIFSMQPTSGPKSEGFGVLRRRGWRERSVLSSAQAASARAGYRDMLGGAESEPMGGFEIVDNNDGNRGTRPH
jgi:hypothetical protein